MLPRASLVATVFAVVVSSLAPLTEEGWNIRATFVNACSCQKPCPCYFGSPATHGYCEDNSLVEIEKGQFRGVSLDGVRFVFTSHVMDEANWRKYYVESEATDAQVDAVVRLMNLLLPEQNLEILGVQRGVIAIERRDATIKFSTPESTVEIKQVKGLDGKPIKILNLPSRLLADYTQYEAVTNAHTSKGRKFSYVGTTAFTSTVDAHSE